MYILLDIDYSIIFIDPMPLEMKGEKHNEKKNNHREGFVLENKIPLAYCDHCGREVYREDIFFCPETGDIIHLSCLVEWARGMVRKCNIEDFLHIPD